MNNERLMVMRNKIENVGLEDCGVDGGLVAEIIDELIDSRFQIESLTAERDEAREEIERLKRETETLKGYFHKSAFETADGYQVVINRKGNDQLANLQHEDGDGGYYDLLPGGLDQ